MFTDERIAYGEIAILLSGTRSQIGASTFKLIPFSGTNIRWKALSS